MKIKSDFITNSSSASFIIHLQDITALQRRKIYDHSEIAEDNEWSITESIDHIYGRTWMDNFDMWEYLESIGIDMSKVNYERD